MLIVITFSKRYEKSKYNVMIVSQHENDIYTGDYFILRLGKTYLITKVYISQTYKSTISYQ